MDSILCLVLVIVSLRHNVCSSLHHQYGMELVHMVADKPQTIHVDEQQKTIFLACEIKTNAQLKWYYNDTEITKNPPPYVLDWNKGSTGEKGSILMIRQPRDGKYDCEAQTSSLLIKATVHIIVKQRHLLPDGFPKIEVHPINVYTRRDSVDFNCCVTGQPPFRFKWYYNRNPIGSDRIHEVSQTVVKDDMFCSNLKVTNVSVSVGFYQCVIMNKIGQVVTKDAKIAFNGDHRRKRREVIDKLKCNSIPAPKNITEYPGIVKHTSIHRSCSGSEKMIIRWSEPEYASHVLYYKISIMGEFEEHSRCYLVSKDKLTFDLNTDRRFYANCSYTVVVRTIPELPEISRQALTVQQLYKCPYDGVWSEWSSWSTCICKEKCVGSGVCYTKKTRTKDCLVPSVYNESVRIPGNKARCQAGELHDQSSQEGTCAYTAKTCRSMSSISSQSKSGEGSIDYQGFIIAGIIGTLACTVAIIFIIRRNKGRYLTYQHTVEAKEKPNVYVSYIAGNEKSEDRILNLVASLSNYGINFKMDILCQVEINNNGGLPIWLQDNVLTTDKILVVLTKEYVKALQTEGNDLPNSICKIHSEYKLINNFMYQSCQRTPKVVIMIESGITGDLIPPTYRNLYHCSYPKQYKDTDEAFNALVGMLLDTEPVQVHIQ